MFYNRGRGGWEAASHVLFADVVQVSPSRFSDFFGLAKLRGRPRMRVKHRLATALCQVARLIVVIDVQRRGRVKFLRQSEPQPLGLVSNRDRGQLDVRL